MKTTWQQLLDLEPGLRQWQDDARSIAREARWNWYGRWLPTFHKLKHELHDVADRHGLDFADVHRLAVAELVSIYETERRRQAKRKGKRR